MPPTKFIFYKPTLTYALGDIARELFGCVDIFSIQCLNYSRFTDDFRQNLPLLAKIMVNDAN